MKRPRISDDEQALSNPEDAWLNELWQFVIQQDFATDELQIDWSDFQSKLRSYLATSNRYWCKQANSLINHLTYQGAVCAAAGHDDVAIANFKQVIESEQQKGNTVPGDLLVHFWLVASYLRSKQYQALVDHVERFQLDTIEATGHYADPLYLNISYLSPETILKQRLYLGYTRFYQSELCLFYGLALKHLERDFNAPMRQMYYSRGKNALLHHHFNVALGNFKQGIGTCVKDLDLWQGLLLTQILRGHYDEVLDASIIEQISGINHPARYSLLISVANFYFRMHHLSHVRLCLETLPLSDLSNLDQIKLLNLKIKLTLQDNLPSWQILHQNFERYQSALAQLSIVETGRSECIDDYAQLLHKSMQKANRLNELKQLRPTILSFLAYYDSYLQSLETILGHPNGTLPAFPNRCYDWVYLKILRSMLNLYVWFPRLDSLNPMLLVRQELINRIRQIPTQLTSYRVPIKSTPLAEGVRSELISIARLAKMGLITQGNDYSINDCIEAMLRSGVSAEENHHFTGSEHSGEASVDQSSEAFVVNSKVDILEHYSAYYSSYIDMLTPKPYSLSDTTMAKQAQRFIDSRDMALRNAVGDFLYDHETQMLALMVSVEQALESNNPSTIASAQKQWLACVVSATQLIQTVMPNHQNETGIFDDQYLRIRLKEQLIEKSQSILLRYLSDTNRLIQALIKLNVTKPLLAVFKEQALFAWLNAYCVEPHYYHNDFALMMSIQLLDAFKKNTHLKEQVFNENQKKLTSTLSSLSASQLTHPLDVFYSTSSDAAYRVPFPAQLLCEPIKQTVDLIVSKKNLSTHALTIVYSSKFSDKIMHLHVPLGFAHNQSMIVNGFVETADYVSQLEQNILSRVQRGHALVNLHRQKNVKDPCNVIPAGTMPNKFENWAHRHSEQYFYAWLSSLSPEDIIDKISKLPGGYSFVPGSKVHMLALDMGSLLTSCHSCRLSAMSVQNHKNEFVKIFSKYLLNSGYKIANKTIQTITRVLAAKNNRCDPDELIHKNPQERNIEQLHGFGFFQVQAGDAFVSGSTHNAFKPPIKH